MASSVTLPNGAFNRLSVNRLEAISAKIRNQTSPEGNLKSKMLNFLKTIPNQESIGCYALFNPDDSLNFEITEFGQDLNTYQWSASLAKPLTSLLIGVAQKQGILKSTDMAIDYLPTLAGTVVENATIDDLMSMRAGLIKDSSVVDYTIPGLNTTDASGLSLYAGALEILPTTNMVDGIIKIILNKNLTGPPVYNSKNKNVYSDIGSQLVNDYTPNTGFPDDLQYSYSSASINLASAVLLEAVAKSKGFSQKDGYTTMPIQQFINWAEESLINKMTNNEYRVYFYTDKSSTYWYGGFGIYAPNKFYTEIFKILKNNGVINGEQVVDRQYCEEINNFDVNIETNETNGNWKSITNRDINVYYFRGFGAYFVNSSSYGPQEGPVFLHGGVGGIMIITSQDNYMSAIFPRNIPNELSNNSLSLPYFIAKISAEDATIFGQITYRFYTKLTLEDGTQLNTKEDWDNLKNLIDSRNPNLQVIYRMTEVGQPMLRSANHTTAVQSILGIRLSSDIIPQPELVDLN
jgi:hypothetical protein